MTRGERLTLSVAVLFTPSRGKLLTDTYWSELWADWREAARLAEGRHLSLLAPLLRHHADEQRRGASGGVEVAAARQPADHVETYVHWMPKKDRPRGLVGGLRRDADSTRREPRAGQDRS